MARTDARTRELRLVHSLKTNCLDPMVRTNTRIHDSDSPDPMVHTDARISELRLARSLS